jgi:hypothetical protein
MAVPDWKFVELVRDFFTVHQTMRSLFGKFRDGSLDFAEVAELVGSSDSSVLFRLKERCHALFRETDDLGAEMRREALFDLSVGSLFHDAMRLRETLYQQQIYAPRVEQLLSEAGHEKSSVFRDFEKLHRVGVDRTFEAVRETDALLEQTSSQLRVLLADFPRNGLISRYLYEHAARVEDVFGLDLPTLLAEIHGEPIVGYRRAVHSYLHSAFFREARGCTEEAFLRCGEDRVLRHLLRYAIGMEAFLEGRYRASLDALEAWVDGGPHAEEETEYLSLSHNAVSRIAGLVKGSDEERGLMEQSSRLVTRLAEKVVSIGEAGDSAAL